MSEIRLQIDGKDVVATEGMTLLQAARSVGVAIPTLCDHEKLVPYGACRICTVEADTQGRTSMVAACLFLDQVAPRPCPPGPFQFFTRFPMIAA